MRKSGSSRAAESKLALTAVALQDHLSRSLALQHSLCLGAPARRRGGRQAPEAPRGNGGRGGRAQPKPRAPPQPPGGEEREYVLDPALPPMTLAQKLGLVAAPPRRLTVAEWMEVKSRSVQEGDSSQPCVICREEFRLQPQVLLSCSHVFHKVCLQAYERFSGRKSCPMCRMEQYETRLIHDGARVYRERCAVRIQSCWRGYAVRKWYREMRRLVPPKDKQLRRNFFLAKFQEMNDSLVRSCASDIEAFLSDIDQSVAASREVLRRLDTERPGKMEEEAWLRTQEKAVQRGVGDCTICLAPLRSPGRAVLLLSCSHLFHQPCLQAFELFCLEARPTCPLCRARYTSRAV